MRRDHYPRQRVQQPPARACARGGRGGGGRGFVGPPPSESAPSGNSAVIYNFAAGILDFVEVPVMLSLKGKCIKTRDSRDIQAQSVGGCRTSPRAQRANLDNGIGLARCSGEAETVARAFSLAFIFLLPCLRRISDLSSYRSRDPQLKRSPDGLKP
jgi:hypothetical protein